MKQIFWDIVVCSYYGLLAIIFISLIALIAFGTYGFIKKSIS